MHLHHGTFTFKKIIRHHISKYRPIEKVKLLKIIDINQDNSRCYLKQIFI